MTEAIDLALQIIRVDFFIGFALYSLLYIILAQFIKKPILEIIDNEANKLISFVGLLYLLVWAIGIATMIGQNNSEENTELFSRIFGKYWFGYWMQPLLWIAATQLLRLKAIRKNILSRIIISLVLLISIEQFVLLTVSLHRDYLPSSWHLYDGLDLSPFVLIFGILGKITLYLLFTGTFYTIRTWSKKLLARGPN